MVRVWTVRTASGATAAQIVLSSRSRKIQHLGSAHTKAELEALKAKIILLIHPETPGRVKPPAVMLGPLELLQMWLAKLWRSAREGRPSLATTLEELRPIFGAPSQTRRRTAVRPIERRNAGRTALEIISRFLFGDADAVGIAEVVFRVGNRAQGKSMELSVTTPNRSWSWSTSSTEEPRV